MPPVASELEALATADLHSVQQPEAEVFTSAPPAWMRGVAVIVADDSAVTAFAVAETLARWKAQPLVVPRAEAVLRELQRALQAGRVAPALVLDPTLEDDTGWDLLARLRERPDLLGRGVVLLVGAEEADRARAEAGCVVLLKPARESELRRALHAVLRVGPQRTPSAAAR